MRSSIALLVAVILCAGPAAPRASGHLNFMFYEEHYQFRNVPTAACHWTQPTTALAWGVTGGTWSAIKRFYKKTPRGVVEIGAYVSARGIYPVPWCHLTFDGTCSCSYYWCGEHIWDEVIPQPSVWESRFLLCNLGPSEYDYTVGEGHYLARLVGGNGKLGLNGLPVLCKMSAYFPSNVRPGRFRTAPAEADACRPCRFGSPGPPTSSPRGGRGSGGGGSDLGSPDGGLIWGGY